jgi:hypothetical protein
MKTKIFPMYPIHQRRPSLKFMGTTAFLCLLSFGLTGRLSAQAITLEAASMSPVGTGATVSTSSDPNVSGGLLEFLNSTAVGQSMTLMTPTIAAGTYQVQFRYKTNTSRAQHNVVIDGTQIGGTIDQYATTSTYPTATLGNVAFATTGTHAIVLTVTGKDAAATHFYITADSFTFTPVNVQPQAAAPSFSPSAGAYTSAQTVSIASTTGTANIRYTTDGSTPSETAGTIYSSPVSISTTLTLKAIAYETGFTDSTVTSGAYTINTGTGGGTTVSFEAESLSPVGTGATVSTSSDPNVTGGLLEFLNSTAAGQTMTLTTPSIAAGTYQVQFRYKTNTSRGQHTVEIDGAQVGGTVDQYTATPTYPTATLGNVTFNSAGTHTIVLTVTGKNASATQFYITADKFTFVAQSGGGPGTVAAPSFSPGGGTYSSTQNVSISTATTGASIRYTTDGSTPTSTAGALYSGTEVNITATTTLQAIAFASGMNNSPVTSATYTINTGGGGNFTAAQVLAGVQSHMTSSVQVNTKPHINTMTRALNVNVYQVASGVFAYTSSMAIDDDGSDPDPDPDHQNQTTWQDDSGAQLGAHHVPYYVLGDDCWDNEKAQGGDFHPCPHFYYPEHNITGLQFALIFYNGKVIGAVFGDTQGTDVTSTSSNDSRELGEASVESAALLGIPSSGTTGGVDNGVTVVIFSGPQWVVKGTNKGTGPVGSSTGSLNGNAQALVQKALNQLGTSFGL